jgi:hypothetical protein
LFRNPEEGQGSQRAIVLVVMMIIKVKALMAHSNGISGEYNTRKGAYSIQHWHIP